MIRHSLSLIMVLSIMITPLAFASESERHHEMMKDVKKEVEKIENGVIIKITSDNPETVRRIQEMVAEHKDMGTCKHKPHKCREKGHHS